MKVALYLRMSTDKQETSIPQQRAELERYAEKHGYEIVREYRDEGISGDATAKRKGFLRMIAEAPTGDFDRILCWDQDRFGRFDMIEAGRWISPLRDARVTLETVAQGFIDWNDFGGRLTYAVAQEGKHQFLQDLSRNVVRGLTDKAASGRGYTGGPTPFGYCRHTVLEGQGKRTYRVSTLEIDPATAPLVLRMFEEYAAPTGSCRAVVEMLNTSGVRPPRGKVWRRNTVNRILTNRVYAGDAVWGRRMKGKYHARNGLDFVKRHPGEGVVWTQPIERPDSVPAIVPRALFERVQELLIERQKITRAPSRAHPLSGLLTCATCGKPFHSDSGAFRCSSTGEPGAKGRPRQRCSSSRISGDFLLSKVIEGLRSEFLAPAARRAITGKLKAEATRRLKQASKIDTKAIERQINELDRQVAEGVARIPLLPKSLVPDMAKGLDSMRAQRDALKQQLTAAARASKGKATPEVEWVREALNSIEHLARAVTHGIGNEDGPRVNHWLRSTGVGISIKHDNPRQRSATVGLYLPRSEPAKTPGKRRGDLSTTSLRRGQVPSEERPRFSFTIPLPAAPGPAVPIPAENPRKKAKKAG
jgi:site-specific DNA recombinase